MTPAPDTTDLIERLNAAAAKAAPGPWQAEQSASRKYLDAVLFRYQSGMKGTVALVGKDRADVGASELDEQNANSEYIALCSPDNILSLTSELTTLRARLASCEAEREQAYVDCNEALLDTERDFTAIVDAKMPGQARRLAREALTRAQSARAALTKGGEDA